MLIFFILSILHEFDDRMRKHTKQMEAYIELRQQVPLGNFIRYVREQKIETSNMQMQSDFYQGEGVVAFSGHTKRLGQTEPRRYHSNT